MKNTAEIVKDAIEKNPVLFLASALLKNGNKEEMSTAIDFEILKEYINHSPFKQDREKRFRKVVRNFFITVGEAAKKLEIDPNIYLCDRDEECAVRKMHMPLLFTGIKEAEMGTAVFHDHFYNFYKKMMDIGTCEHTLHEGMVKEFSRTLKAAIEEAKGRDCE